MIKAYGITDVGMQRSANQDCFRLLPLADGAYFALVCDGMGGPGGGELASKVAADTLCETFRRTYSPQLSHGELRQLIRSAVQKAGEEVFARSLTKEGVPGMGTTAVGALVLPDAAIFFNIGDSRGYIYEHDALIQITRDHSLVQELVDDGKLTPAEARQHPKRNIITKALGVSDRCDADVYTEEFRSPGQILLCTDGLYNLVDGNEIKLELSISEDPQDTLRKLVALANARGGEDNITAVLILA